MFINVHLHMYFSTFKIPHIHMKLDGGHLMSLCETEQYNTPHH